jgi:hypothetical protein
VRLGIKDGWDQIGPPMHVTATTLAGSFSQPVIWKKQTKEVI